MQPARVRVVAWLAILSAAVSCLALPAAASPREAAASRTAAVATACAPVDASAIVGWWRGEDDLLAEIGPDLTGTSSFANGKVNRAFALSGSSRLGVASFPAVGSGVSIDTWMKPVQTNEVQAVITKWQLVASSDGSSAFALFLTPNGHLLWETDETSTLRPLELEVAAPQLFDGQLHHVAATWDDVASKVYVDGVEIGSHASQGGTLNEAATTPFRLGSSAGVGTPFSYTGVLDEPTVYDRALTPSEIAAIFNAGSAGKCQRWSQQVKVTASDATAFDHYGAAVAISGTTVVVGANTDDDLGNGSGSAYVLVRSGASWAQQAKLTAADGAAEDQFGAAVAVSGDTIVIGALHNASFGESSGAVYVFTRAGTTWTQQAKLTAGDGAEGDQFGMSVAVDGDTVAVGANGHGDNGPSSGSAYVFTRTGVTWAQQAKLDASDGAADDFFGQSIALHGNTVVVGSPFRGDGAAYVFARTGVTWAQQAKLQAADAGSGPARQLGWSVDVDLQTVVVGANTDSASADLSGSAYVFVRTGVTWAQQAKLTPGTTAAGDQLGWSVAVSGNVALVGAPLDDQAGASSGSVYAFARTGTTWTQEARLTAADAASGNGLGWSSALDGSTAVIGAAFADTVAGFEAGAVYVFAR